MKNWELIDNLSTALHIGVLALGATLEGVSAFPESETWKRELHQIDLLKEVPLRDGPQLHSNSPGMYWMKLSAKGRSLVLGPFIPRPPHIPSEELYLVRYRYIDEASAVATVAAALLASSDRRAALLTVPLPEMDASESLFPGISREQYYQSTTSYLRRSLRQRIATYIRTGDADGWKRDGPSLLESSRETMGLPPDLDERRKYFIAMASLGAQDAEGAGADAYTVQAILDRYLTWVLSVDSENAFGAMAFRIVSEFSEAVARAPFRGTSSKVAQVVTFVRSKLTEVLTLSAVAQVVSLSPNYLIRRLRLETGGGFRELVARLRTQEAKNLLDSTVLEIGVIARRVGYRYPSHFSKAFRSIVGMTPQEYRDQGRKATEETFRR